MLRFAILILTLTFLSGCSIADSPAKNVILVIGDGMGPQQIGLLELYSRRSKIQTISDRQTAFQRLSHKGQLSLLMTDPASFLVNDSACGATQLGSGAECLPEVLGKDKDGAVVETIFERSRNKGRSVGLVSDTRITHATPAAFAVHVDHRSNESEIAKQLIAADPTLLFSGGLDFFNQELLNTALSKGYQLVKNKQQLAAVEGGKVLGLFSPQDMAAFEGEHLSEPSLPEMTEKALTLLSDNQNGFFVMIEAGQIDWAGHANDAGWLLHEMIKFDQTLRVIESWLEGRDDTLLLITADHETGGFGIDYSSANGEGSDFRSPALLDQLYQQRTKQLPGVKSNIPGIVWASTNHTHTPVPLLAVGSSEILKELKGVRHARDLGGVLLKLF